MDKEGLGKGFAEKWVDVSSGEPCGRSKAQKTSRGYPACRPKSISDKMTEKEKDNMARKKTSSTRQSWPVSPSGKRKTT